MLLYNNQLSGNCYKVRLLAAQLGLSLDLREVDVLDRAGRPELLGGLNPALRVPVLILDDGRALPESNAIIHYLAEGTEYLPENRFERAQVLQWLFFEQYSHEPHIAILRFWSLFDIEASDEQRKEKRWWGNLALSGLDKHLRDHTFLVGERYTIADIALYAYTHVAPEGGFELERYTSVTRWLERVGAQPGHVPLSA